MNDNRVYFAESNKLNVQVVKNNVAYYAYVDRGYSWGPELLGSSPDKTRAVELARDYFERHGSI